MDKYEYKYLADEIRALIDEKRYEEAVEIADKIDWHYVKNGLMLCRISDLYKVCGRYREAKDVLLLAYQRNPTGKLILYSLCELSLKLNELEDALETCSDYWKYANGDPNRFLLKYKVFDAQDIALDERITLLESYEKNEPKDRWMYELAWLYHRVGAETSCVEECDKIVTFFGEGTYVVKALELKRRHRPWTYEDRVLYENLTGVSVEGIDISEMNVGKFSTMNLQKELADNVMEVMGYNTAEFNAVEEDPVLYADTTEVYRSFKEPEIPMVDEVTEGYEGQQEANVQPAEVYEAQPEAYVQPFEGYEAQPEAYAQPLEGYEAQPEAFAKPTESYEAQEAINIQPAAVVKPVEENYASMEMTEIKVDETSNVEAVHANAMEEKVVISGQTDTELENTQMYNKAEIESYIAANNAGALKAEKAEYSKMDDMLSLEGDGQIGMVVPDVPMIDKQITGQMSFQGILEQFAEESAVMCQQWTADIAVKVDETRERIIKSYTDNNSYAKEIAEALDESNTYQTDISSEEIADISEDEGYEEVELIMLEDGTIVELSSLELVEEVEFVEDDSEQENTYTSEVVDITASEEVVEEETFEEELPVVDLSVMEAATGAEPAEIEATESEPIESEPTLEELSFDRTEFVNSDDIEDEVNADEVTENTQVDENYLEEFAKSSERYDNVVNEENNEAEAEESDNIVTSEEISSAISEAAIVSIGLDSLKDATDDSDASDQDMKVVTKKKKPLEVANSQEEKTSKATVEDLPEYEGFTEDQIGRFESYIYTESGSEQVKNALGLISMTGSTGNLIIGSTDKEGSVDLGKAFIMEISNKEKVDGNVAKIKASSLNSKDISETLSKLKGGALIILEANELTRETLAKINEVLADPEFRILIVLTMITRHKHKFIMENSNLLDAFNIRIDIENVDDQELVNYASSYAYSLEYAINAMGSLALHTRIDEKQTNSHNVTISEVKELVDNAIDHASKKTIGHFFDILLGKRYDENDMVILGEKDFA